MFAPHPRLANDCQFLVAFLLGGGGEGGFQNRTPEVKLSQLTSAGVTTVVGCLGTDGVGRDMTALISKARGLEAEGITTYPTSEAFAKQIDQLGIQGKSQLTFVIGGSLGLSQEVMTRSDAKISFGKMTYPHQLMKLILLEQIYRAYRINRGAPYHK